MTVREIVKYIQAGLRDPLRALLYFKYKVEEVFFWEKCYRSVHEPKVRGRVPHYQEIQEEIIKELRNSAFDVRFFRIDTLDFKRYVNEARYNRFRNYYGGGKGKNFVEKALEHYLAANLLELTEKDTYVDIASANSPTPMIYHEMFGCNTYVQDLVHAKGIRGNVIGGDASSLPVEDGFFTKMALHCSFEHFECDADVRFIQEASRVLRRNGKLCILPLYLFRRYAIETNPLVVGDNCASFESDATLFCVRGTRKRHGRFYDVRHLVSRIRHNLGELSLSILVAENEKEVDSSCYVKFIALLEKR